MTNLGTTVIKLCKGQSITKKKKEEEEEEEEEEDMRRIMPSAWSPQVPFSHPGNESTPGPLIQKGRLISSSSVVKF